MKILNLGCGDRPLAGAVNHDRRSSAHTDVFWDLEDERWPIIYLDETGKPRTHLTEWRAGGLSGAFDQVVARDLLEHIAPNRFYRVLDNIWCQLRAGGLLKIQVPEAGSTNALTDPTHWRGFVLNSFDFLDPRTRLGRATWTTDKRWHILERQRVPRSDVNLTFTLEKILCFAR